MIEFGLDGGLKIPPKSQVGSLAADIANEGYKVSEGQQESWVPPKKQDMFPDWSQFKSIQKYFGRKGFQPWPSWIFHPKDEAKIVKDAEEAADYGIIYREATEDEKFRGLGPTYDFVDGTKWRTRPYPGTQKFDYRDPGTGKVYESPKPDYQRSQHDMMRNLVAALQEGKPSGSTLSVEDMARAMAMAMQMMSQVSAPAGVSDVPAPIEAADSQERAAWILEAEERGVKIDKRWGLDRIKAEIEKNG